MDYEKAKAYWDIKDKDSKVMDKEPLLKWLDKFLTGHNTLALATAAGDYVDCTPLEYNYVDGKIYILTEGGHKFIGLEKNKNVSASVFEPYTGFGNIQSVQIYGTCEVVEQRTDEYYRVTDSKHMPRTAVDKISLYCLKINMTKVQMLSTDFKKEGFTNRQAIDF